MLLVVGMQQNTLTTSFLSPARMTRCSGNLLTTPAEVIHAIRQRQSGKMVDSGEGSMVSFIGSSDCQEQMPGDRGSPGGDFLMGSAT